MDIDWPLARTDIEHRNEIVVAYLPLVKFVVARTSRSVTISPGLSHEDLVSFGIIGLIDAISKFNETLGVPFKTYAYMRIRGTIIDELRSMDWAPRSLRSESRDLAAATESLLVEHGREPTDEEIAVLMETTSHRVKQIRNLVQESHVSSISAAYEAGHDSQDITNIDAGDIGAEKERILDAMSSAVDRLPQLERQILRLHYWEKVPLKHVSSYVGITQQAATRHYANGLRLLREYMADVY